jgi:hypothetical protein
MQSFLAPLLLVASLALATSSAHACECPARPSSDAADLKASDTVFSGTVLSSTLSADGTTFVHQVEVDGLYKGSVQRVTEVVTKAGKSCGFPFEEGKRYLLFSTGHAPRTVTTCGRTRALESASGKLPRLPSASCALALAPALDTAAQAATRFFKTDFTQHPSSHVTVFCLEAGRAHVTYRSRTIPKEQLSQVRDGIQADVVLHGKTGKVERVLVGP